MNEWKKRVAESPAAEAPVTERGVRRQLASAAGAESFQDRDPIHHLTESFRNTFDLMGQQRANGESPNLETALQAYMKDLVPGLSGFGEKREGAGKGQGRGEGAGGGRLAGEFLSRTSMDPYYATRELTPGSRMLNKFSELTFNRGVMASAVMQGQGKMMLFSCLKRTVCQDKPMYLRERKLFQSQSAHRMLPQSRGDVAIVNKGFADSAVGLVVDVLKDARQVLDSFTQLAESGGAGGAGSDTMRRMYPFLTDDRERALLAGYRGRLETAGVSDDERDLMQRAIVKTEAMIAKKDQMKRDFLQKLRYISYNAASAAAEFSQDEFRQELLARLNTQEPDELPPPDDGDGDGDGRGAPDGAPDNGTDGEGNGPPRFRRRKGGEEQTE